MELKSNPDETLRNETQKRGEEFYELISSESENESRQQVHLGKRKQITLTDMVTKFANQKIRETDVLSKAKKEKTLFNDEVIEASDHALQDKEVSKHNNKEKEYMTGLGAKRKCCQKIQIRNSPKVFSAMLKTLSTEQKQWVTQSGFGALLNFRLNHLPHSIGFNLVQSYDHDSNILNINDNHFKIIEEDVEFVLGMPHGGVAVEFERKKEVEKITKLWRDQFEEVEEKWTIPAQLVCEKIEKSTDADLLFKLNFLVIMSNTFFSSNSNNYVSQSILSFKGDIDNCGQYNWCAYLIECLKEAKKDWNKSKKKSFFNGPLIFLTLLYVDRVVYHGEEDYKRHWPVFLGWDDKKLRERQKQEDMANTFGNGCIRNRFSLQKKCDENHIDQDQAEAEHNKYIKQQYDIAKLQDYATQYVVKVEESKQAEELYMEMLKECSESYGEEKTVENITKYVKEALRRLHPDKNKDDKGTTQNKDCIGQNKDDMDSDNINCIAHELMDGNKTNCVDQEDEYIDVISIAKEVLLDCTPDEAMQSEKIKSFDENTENVNVLNMDEEDLIFEIGDEVVEEQNDKHDAAKIKNKKASPAIRAKTKRAIKIPDVHRSPFVQRTADINKNLTVDENCLYMWVQSQCTQLKRKIFDWKGGVLTIQNMHSLLPGKKVDAEIISNWSLIQNSKESLKAKESPLRFFLKTFMVELAKEELAAENFEKNMTDMLQLFPDISIQELSLVFFPISTSNHYYLLCFDLKNMVCEIIDNSNLVPYRRRKYTGYNDTMRNRFADYVTKFSLDKGEAMKKLKPVRRKMDWMTNEDKVNSGIFLMRHMETYKGIQMHMWDPGFGKESATQRKKLNRLRKRYCHMMLLSDYNLLKNEVQDQMEHD